MGKRIGVEHYFAGVVLMLVLLILGCNGTDKISIKLENFSPLVDDYPTQWYSSPITMKNKTGQTLVADIYLRFTPKDSVRGITDPKELNSSENASVYYEIQIAPNIEIPPTDSESFHVLPDSIVYLATDIPEGEYYVAAVAKFPLHQTDHEAGAKLASASWKEIEEVIDYSFLVFYKGYIIKGGFKRDPAIPNTSLNISPTRTNPTYRYYGEAILTKPPCDGALEKFAKEVKMYFSFPRQGIQYAEFIDKATVLANKTFIMEKDSQNSSIKKYWPKGQYLVYETAGDEDCERRVPDALDLNAGNSLPINLDIKVRGHNSFTDASLAIEPGKDVTIEVSTPDVKGKTWLIKGDILGSKTPIKDIITSNLDSRNRSSNVIVKGTNFLSPKSDYYDNLRTICVYAKEKGSNKVQALAVKSLMISDLFLEAKFNSSQTKIKFKIHTSKSLPDTIYLWAYVLRSNGTLSSLIKEEDKNVIKEDKNKMTNLKIPNLVGSEPIPRRIIGLPQNTTWDFPLPQGWQSNYSRNNGDRIFINVYLNRCLNNKKNSIRSIRPYTVTELK